MSPEDDMMSGQYACLGFLAGFHRNCTNKNVLVDNLNAKLNFLLKQQRSLSFLTIVMSLYIVV